MFFLSVVIVYTLRAIIDKHKVSFGIGALMHHSWRYWLQRNGLLLKGDKTRRLHFVSCLWVLCLLLYFALLWLFDSLIFSPLTLAFRWMFRHQLFFRWGLHCKTISIRFRKWLWFRFKHAMKHEHWQNILCYFKCGGNWCDFDQNRSLTNEFESLKEQM